MKYVMVRQKENKTFVYPIVFSDHLNHSDVVPFGYEPVSAGFVGEALLSFDRSDEIVYGKSDSLKLKPHDNDGQHLYNWFNFGNSMMICSSLEYNLD